jgi:hypothetical protein
MRHHGAIHHLCQFSPTPSRMHDVEDDVSRRVLLDTTATSRPSQPRLLGCASGAEDPSLAPESPRLVSQYAPRYGLAGARWPMWLLTTL